MSSSLIPRKRLLTSDPQGARLTPARPGDGGVGSPSAGENPLTTPSLGEGVSRTEAGMEPADSGETHLKIISRRPEPPRDRTGRARPQRDPAPGHQPSGRPPARGSPHAPRRLRAPRPGPHTRAEPHVAPPPRETEARASPLAVSSAPARARGKGRARWVRDPVRRSPAPRGPRRRPLVPGPRVRPPVCRRRAAAGGRDARRGWAGSDRGGVARRNLSSRLEPGHRGSGGGARTRPPRPPGRPPRPYSRPRPPGLPAGGPQHPPRGPQRATQP